VTASASAGTAHPTHRAGAPDTPGMYHSTEPAWNDQNLRELSGHITSPLFFTHIRAAIASAVQETNCHPFRHNRWLFMHNGYINEFARIKRDLILSRAGRC
jgi:predicted glutamine amidotransferase